MSEPYWTVLVDNGNCIGRFRERAKARDLAKQLGNRLRCRPKTIRLHYDLTSLQKEMSTR